MSETKRTSNNILQEMFESILVDGQPLSELTKRDYYFSGYRQAESLILHKIDKLEGKLNAQKGAE